MISSRKLCELNRPFSGCPKPLFETRLIGRPLIWKWFFTPMQNRTHFRRRGFSTAYSKDPCTNPWNFKSKKYCWHEYSFSSWVFASNFSLQSLWKRPNRNSSRTNSVFILFLHFPLLTWLTFFAEANQAWSMHSGKYFGVISRLIMIVKTFQ